MGKNGSSQIRKVLDSLGKNASLYLCDGIGDNPRVEHQSLPYQKRVVLVTPPSPFLMDQRVFVSLGILKVAASLEAHGYAVEHLDLSGVSQSAEALVSHLNRTKAKVIGFTATTPQMPSVVALVEHTRRCRPDMRIILGGPHVTLTHSAVKLEKKRGVESRAHEAYGRLANLVDVLVSGDGEYAVIAAMEYLGSERGTIRSKDAMLIDGDDPKGGYFLTNEIYEKTPMPARHLIDMKSYHYSIEGRNSTSLIAQLGCPFACGFCGGRNSKSLRMIRTRSSQSIVAEIETLYRTYGYTGFMFYDDELNVNKNMVGLMNELKELQSRLGVDFRLRGFVKSQLFTLEQAKAMYAAGFRWILSGFESGAPRILENINKKADVDDNNRAVDFARAANLKVKALMSIGHPGEDEKTVEQTQQWLMQAKPDDFDCTVITTYPGTPYYDESVPHEKLKNVWTYTYQATGDRLHSYDVDFMKVADFYKGHSNGGYKSFVFTDALSAERIVALRQWVEDSVRQALNIPYPTARPALQFEHSMGQGANAVLPDYLYHETAQQEQTSDDDKVAA